MSQIFLSETAVLVSVHCCLLQLKVAWSSKYYWLFCFHSENVSCKRDETPRRVIQWLTRDQKMTLVKTVCSLITVRFTTHVQTFHDKRSCKLREYWLLDVIIRLSRLIRAFCHLLQNKFALGKRNIYKFSCKKSTTLCFLQQLFATWKNLNCCKRGLNPSGKTHNITFQLENKGHVFDACFTVPKAFVSFSFVPSRPRWVWMWRHLSTFFHSLTQCELACGRGWVSYFLSPLLLVYLSCIPALATNCTSARVWFCRLFRCTLDATGFPSPTTGKVLSHA